MAKQQKEVHKVKMTDGKRAIIQQLLEEYDIESTSDIQDALKDLLGGTIKEMKERGLLSRCRRRRRRMHFWIVRRRRGVRGSV